MDKATAKVVQAEMGDALKVIAAKHGLTITSNRSTYDDASFNLSVKTVSAAPEDQAARWERYAPAYGLPTGVVGDVVTINRKPYQIVGLDLNRQRFNVRVLDLTTRKTVLFEADAVRRALTARVSIDA